MNSDAWPQTVSLFAMRSVVGSSRTLVPDPLPFWIIHVAAPLSPLVRASKQAGSDNDTNSNTNENHSNAQNVSNNDDNSIVNVTILVTGTASFYNIPKKKKL